MAVLKQWVCAVHGEYESTIMKCEDCGHAMFVKQEIRTAPAFHGRSTKFIDGQLREIADDAGLTDLRNDPKAGVSVLQAMQNKKNLSDIQKPRWGMIQHAAPGFSHDPNAKVPTITAESMGFQPTPAAQMSFPDPKQYTRITGVREK